MSGSIPDEDFGAFQPGVGTKIGSFEFRRWDSRRYTGQIAVYDEETDETEPVGYAPGSIKTEAEAEIWLEGFQAGLNRGIRVGRENLQSEMRDLLNVR